MAMQKNISEDFIVMSPDKQASIEPRDAGLYQRLDEKYSGFAGHDLIACYSFRQSWPTWEMHPHGDEVVMLLEGEVTFVLKLNGEEVSQALTDAGAYVVVPKGVWHTARVESFARVLFITPGEGTRNEPV